MHHGAEAQFVQGSTAQFKFYDSVRIISAPGSQGHSHSSLLRTGDSAALVNPLKSSLKIVHRWIAFYTEGEEGPGYKVCLHVGRDPRYKVCTPVAAQREVAAPLFTNITLGAISPIRCAR